MIEKEAEETARTATIRAQRMQEESEKGWGYVLYSRVFFGGWVKIMAVVSIERFKNAA